MLDEYFDVMTIDEVAEALRISRSSVMRLLDNNNLAYRKIGRVYRISKATVIDFLKNKSDNKSE